LSGIDLNALLSVYIWVGVTQSIITLPLPLQYFVSFLRKSTTFPATSERGGECGTERDVPVHCWGEVVAA